MYILHGSLWEWVILQLNDLNPSFSLIYFGKSSKLYGHLDSFGGFPHFFRDTPTFCMHPGPTCGFHQWSDVTKTEPQNWGFNRCSWKNPTPVEIFHETLAKICKNGEILACQLVSSSFSSTTVQLHVSVILGEEFRSPFFCHLSQAGGFVSETSWLWLPIYTILRRTIFELCKLHSKELHLKRKLTWNPKIEVWKMIFVVNWVRFRFHVNFQGTNIFYPIPKGNSSFQ